MRLVIFGKVDAVVHKDEKTYNGRVSPSHDVIQFISNSSNGLSITKVKSFDIGAVSVGQDVKLSVSVSAVEGSVYYKMIELIK